MTTTDTPSTGSTPAIQGDVADGLLFHLANTLADLSTRIPGGLWYRIGLADLPAAGWDPASPDIEIKTPGGENARLIADAIPWAGPVHHHTDPGTEMDHYVWDGVFGDFRVRVVGLEPLGGAS